MNDTFFIPGLIIFLLGVFFGLITPAYWCYLGENATKLTCCFPIIFNSTLIIIGVCLIVISST